MKRNTVIKLALFAAAAAGLAGCGGGGGGSATTTAPPSVSLESKFGSQFAVDFDQPSTATPAKPVAGDIIPLTLTSPPTPLH